MTRIAAAIRRARQAVGHWIAGPSRLTLVIRTADPLNPEHIAAVRYVIDGGRLMSEGIE